MTHAARSLKPLPALIASMVLAGCASTTPLFPGDLEATVIARHGPPAARYAVGTEQWLEYPGFQQTWFAHINGEGKLTAWEPVLTQAKFATITLDKADKALVLRTIGRPVETAYLSLPKLEVWSYRYKESGVWNSMMHVHFDASGIVRKMENGPDPYFERESRFFGRGRW
ncbi:MAG: hypothetical protein RL748_1694 [Pseudomonadota bacterium]|jgi:hypothetical protein